MIGPDGAWTYLDRRLLPLAWHRPDARHRTVPDELITGVELPPPSGVSRNSTYRKARDRASFAFAVASVAVGIQTDADSITELRLAFGAVAPKPWRAHRAESALRGGRIGSARIADAVALDFADAKPLPQTGFKIELAVRLATATILELARTSQ